MKVLVAGAAGFIGSHLCNRLLSNKKLNLTAVDNLDSYYSVDYKKERFSYLCQDLNLIQLDLTDYRKVQSLISDLQPDLCINLAAIPGVRFSREMPYKYLKTNSTIQLNFLETLSKITKRTKLIYASSSSVYHKNNEIERRSEDEVLGRPSSIYAQSKKHCEEISDFYAELHDISILGLRFFTVYGPWGRPDMAYWSFLNNILLKKKIGLFGKGKMERCYTYIDDVVHILEKIILGNKVFIGHELYNIGSNERVTNLGLLAALEELSGTKSIFELLETRRDEVTKIIPDLSKSHIELNYVPQTNFSNGLEKFVSWYTCRNKV